MNFDYAGIDQQSHDSVPPQDPDQPLNNNFPSHVSSIIGSCRGIVRGGNFLQDCEVVDVQEELGNPIPAWTVRGHVNNIIKFYFEQHSVMAQAQILHGLIKHKKMKPATRFLGFEDAKTKQTCENAIENVKIALSSFGKSRNDDVRDARREITTAVMSRSTSRNRMVATMSSLLKVSKRTLFKYTKFRVRIDENDEVACLLFVDNPIDAGW